ncbi:MAG: hypothetical protein ACI4S9_01525 [Christensenellales bacterium]
MLTRAIVILSGKNGVNGVLKLSCDGEKTRVRVNIAVKRPYVLAINTPTDFFVVSARGEDEFTFPATDLEYIDAAVYRDEERAYYGSTRGGNGYELDCRLQAYIESGASDGKKRAEAPETETIGLFGEPSEKPEAVDYPAEESEAVATGVSDTAPADNVVTERGGESDGAGVNVVSESVPDGVEKFQSESEEADSDEPLTEAAEVRSDEEEVGSLDITVEIGKGNESEADSPGREEEVLRSELYEEVIVTEENSAEDGATEASADGERNGTEEDEKTPCGRAAEFDVGDVMAKLADGGESMKKDKDFYYSVKKTLDELFICYPRDEAMEKLIPGKWIRIENEEGYYVVGIIYEDEQPAYICYGVPETDGKKPPKELEPYCELIRGGNEGYWMLFQNADTGETLKRID